jgi:protein gp37
MFDVITATWNPVIGCLHNCTYCWARNLAETRLNHTEKYKDGFKPKLFEYELKKRFKDRFVFACDMGDLFGRWVPREWIQKIIKAVYYNPESYYLFLTKNPARYFEFLDDFPRNLVLGATIETNRQYPVSNAPSPFDRYRAMANLPWKNKLISIEPVMDFDLETFLQWITKIKPAIVYVGYDNYGNKLPEPSMDKTLELIAELEKFTRVRKKWEKVKEKRIWQIGQDITLQ